MCYMNHSYLCNVKKCMNKVLKMIGGWDENRLVCLISY